MGGAGELEIQLVREPKGPKFEPLPAIELTPDGVDSACHLSEDGEMSTNVLGNNPFGVTCVGVATRPGLYFLPMKLPHQPDAPLRRERNGTISLLNI